MARRPWDRRWLVRRRAKDRGHLQTAYSESDLISAVWRPVPLPIIYPPRRGHPSPPPSTLPPVGDFSEKWIWVGIQVKSVHYRQARPQCRAPLRGTSVGLEEHPPALRWRAEARWGGVEARTWGGGPPRTHHRAPPPRRRCRPPGRGVPGGSPRPARRQGSGRGAGQINGRGLVIISGLGAKGGQGEPPARGAEGTAGSKLGRAARPRGGHRELVRLGHLAGTCRDRGEARDQPPPPTAYPAEAAPGLAYPAALGAQP